MLYSLLEYIKADLDVALDINVEIGASTGNGLTLRQLGFSFTEGSLMPKTQSTRLERAFEQEFSIVSRSNTSEKFKQELLLLAATIILTNRRKIISDFNGPVGVETINHEKTTSQETFSVDIRIGSINEVKGGYSYDQDGGQAMMNFQVTGLISFITSRIEDDNIIDEIVINTI